MPGQKPIRSDSWAWFKAELARRLGEDDAAVLWAELTRRRQVEQRAAQKKRAAREIGYHEALLSERRAQGRATARIEATIARWRAIRDGD